MRVLVVGGGGREHALAWSLERSPSVSEVIAAPGNAGIEQVARCIPDAPSDPAGLAALAEKEGVDLTVVGPEQPLVDGLADELSARGLKVFGPSAAAAQIEGSKAFALRLMQEAGVPTGSFVECADAATARAALDRFDAPYVIKADGLAAGKGVTVAPSRSAAEAAIDACLAGRFGDAGARVLIMEHLAGTELSVFCVTDGTCVVPLAEAQDFKRAYDGDEGPNTGGMGSFSPVPHVSIDLFDRIVGEIMAPAIAALARAGTPYRGVLYGGIMLTDDGPKVFEFNCRFGDPEAQVVLPRYTGDMGELLLACAEGWLDAIEPTYTPDACVTVVLASAGYPGSYETGKVITGLDDAGDALVFHAGTRREADAIVTAGGRVLAVSALGHSVAEARARAYDAASKIDFEGKQFRTDIATDASGEAE